MNIITLDEIKAHCRIDGTAEDSLLVMYGESAEEFVLTYIERSLDEVYELWGEVPKNLKLACLMIVSHSYTHREAASLQKLYEIPYTFDALVKKYEKL